MTMPSFFVHETKVYSLSFDKADAWINDANQFIADEDEETYNYTVRVAAQDLLSVSVDLLLFRKSSFVVRRV